MRTSVATLLAVIAVLTLVSGGQAAVNLVANPGFESPFSGEWTLQYFFGGPSEFMIKDRTTVSHYSGQWGLQFKNNHDGTMRAYFAQTVSGLTPGTSYTLGGWYRRLWKRPDVYDVYIQALGGGLAQRTPTAPEDCTWLWSSVTQTANSRGQIEIRLCYDKFRDTVDYKIADAYYDDISLTPTNPEPSGFAALLAGMTGLGCALRRRRKQA